MDEQTNATFSGWAIVELFGHQREIGYVTARYFGTACMFQIDVPELPEREYVLDAPQYVNSEWTPAGAKVQKKPAPARTRLVGPGSVYALNPCSEAAAMLAIEKLAGREIVVIEIPKDAKKLPAPHAEDEDDPEICSTCGRDAENCTC